jgi:hypothetical protein
VVVCHFLSGCVKRFFAALRAELYSERCVIFTISLREIVKMTHLSKEYSAVVGGKNHFTQPSIQESGLCKKSFYGASRQIIF